jgi:hypothetical protein
MAISLWGIVREAMKLTNDISEMKGSVEKLTDKVQQHNDRLIRLETVVQMATKQPLPELPKE